MEAVLQDNGVVSSFEAKKSPPPVVMNIHSTMPFCASCVGRIFLLRGVWGLGVRGGDDDQ